MNHTTLAFSLKALEQSLELNLHNATRALVEKDLAFEEDFLSLRKSVAFAKEKYDELERTQGNLTAAVLKAMNDFGNRLVDTEEALEEVNNNVETSVGKLRL